MFKDRIFFPGILGFIAFNNGSDISQGSFFKLGLDNFGDFLGRMRIDIGKALLNRIGEFLDNLRVSGEIAFFSAVGSVGDVAGVCAKGSDDITAAF